MCMGKSEKKKAWLLRVEDDPVDFHFNGKVRGVQTDAGNAIPGILSVIRRHSVVRHQRWRLYGEW